MTSYTVTKSGGGYIVRANGEDVLKTKTMRMANRIVAEVRASEAEERCCAPHIAATEDDFLRGKFLGGAI